MGSTDVLIIGAGHAGTSLAAELRRADYGGAVTVINGESVLPYHRPPLSKAWLQGEADVSSGWLQPPGYFDAQGIEVVSATRVVALDAGRRIARTSDGKKIAYRDAVIATGAAARPLLLPGAADLPLLTLRDGTDAGRLKNALTPGSRLAIVGGGFIGLEVAATARHLGVSVCVIARESRVLSRLASEGLSSYLYDLHRGQGVEILLEAGVAGLTGRPNGTIEVVTDAARARTFDYVLVAIGAVPEDDLARSAGVVCANGILVDESGRTSVDHLYAIGDVARRPLTPYLESARLESVHNANEQARIVAAGLCGQPTPRPAVPWFWSDQYDSKLQIAGLLPAEGEVELRGDPTSGSFALLHHKDGKLVCVEAVNAAKEFALGRRQIAAEA